MNRIKIILLFIFIQCFIYPYTSYSEQTNRVALVIGNGEYESSPLKNPTKDANDMANALRELGFEVTLKINVDKRSAENAIREFAQALEEGVVGLFYYAGHGIQTSGSNYLIPIGATIKSETDIGYEAIDLGYILSRMEEANNRLNIIILDACRNNPLTRYARGINRVGLAPSSAPVGSIIAFSTSPGAIALDGEGSNGLYTSSLLENIGTAEITIEELFKKVRREVLKKSDGTQITWETSSLINTFYFNTTGEDIIVKKKETYYALHIASFQKFDNAQKYYKAIKDRGEDIFIYPVEIPGKGIFYRLYFGEFKSKEEAVELAEKLYHEDSMIYIGIAAFNYQGKFTENVKIYSRVRREDEGSIYFMGKPYKKKSQDKAIADYSKAIELNPKDVSLYNNRGTAFLGNQEYDEAITDYSKAIELNPKDVSLYNNRGTAFLVNQQYDEAITDYSKAIELNSNNAIAYFMRGNVYRYKNQLDKAIADYNKAIELSPNYATAYATRGDVYFKNDDIEKACSDWKKAHELGDSSSWSIINRKMCNEN